ncbi:unnamed protein product [Echinostoma caproni]|uniref:BRO1 domain-containing protein n=1 Tax=Echinostoma caproni TaxID=27848 RepID=A0A183B0F6_9TREM|nr:unnamed protein product [Echinostoma caproni]
MVLVSTGSGPIPTAEAKTASGVFDFLSSHVSMFGETSEILSDIMAAYSVTMQAQAQECVFFKAESGPIPAEMVAKIASKAREFYEEALKRCSVSSCKHGIPKLAYDLMKQLASRYGSAFSRRSMVEQIKPKDLTQVPSDGGIGKIELKMPILGTEVKDIFTDLVPLGFLEAKNQADALTRSLVAMEIQRLREATNALNAQVAYLVYFQLVRRVCDLEF